MTECDHGWEIVDRWTQMCWKCGKTQFGEYKAGEIRTYPRIGYGTDIIFPGRERHTSAFSRLNGTKKMIASLNPPTKDGRIKDD